MTEQIPEDPSIIEFLRNVSLFADLPEEDLRRLCALIEVVELEEGQELFREGSKGDRVYIIHSGQLDVIKDSGKHTILLATRGEGHVIGEMALLDEAPRTATVRARSQARLFAIDQEQFEKLLETSPTASRVLFHTVLTRWKGMSSALQQSEKMAQLGTLTAGVAHELNNPAAAVKRGSGQLRDFLAAYTVAQARLARLEFDPEAQARLDELTVEARQAAGRPPVQLDPLTRSDRAYEMETWMGDLGVPDAWELAPTLVNLGYEVESLQRLAAGFEPQTLPAVIGWLGATYNAFNLLNEISQGAERISGIVRALKSYSYLDQAPVQEVDINQGIENTLVILRDKLKGIQIRRLYDPDLPLIQGYGSELNQVWTNLLDNAADALAEMLEPEIVVRTSLDQDWVKVEIEDNGPGIPQEIQKRVFEPFFTTKPPGQGTGLGLEITYSIVVNKHRGDIQLLSWPGKTIFRIQLPLNFEAQDLNERPLDRNLVMDDQKLIRILDNARSIAVVGISTRADRPGQTVPAYLQRQGYRIYPVNPYADQVLGEKAYPDLLSLPEPVDVVEIFRPSDEVLPVVEQAIQIGAQVIWMQEGVINEQAAELARQAGLTVVMDTCMRATHQRLIGPNRQD